MRISPIPAHTTSVISQIAQIRELANQFLERELSRRGISGIVPAHGSILAFLFRQSGPVPIKEIVASVGRVKSTVTGMLQTLEQHGYIEKSPAADDNRVVYISLTAKGQALREPFYAISEELLKKVYGNMPKADRNRLVTLLDQIHVNLTADIPRE
jgi:DNA-binding MarR family transcriptional regulator